MLMRTDPFRELDRLMQNVAGTVARPAAMPMDAYRSGEQFILEIDLPGVAADSIEVTVEKNVLAVSANRSRSLEQSVEVVAAERPYGTFTRQVFLGESLDTDRIDASYTDGVLSLRIPVSEKAKPRRVEISASGSRQHSIDARSTEQATENSETQASASG